MRLDLGECLLGTGQFLLLLLARFLVVLDGLLDACNIGTELVVMPLHGVEGFIGHRQVFTQLLEFRLNPALLGQLGLHGQFAFLYGLLAAAGFLVHGVVAQRQQFRLHLAFFFLEFLVTLRGARLALQLVELLVYFFQQVVQAIEVFTRMPNSVFRLAAPLLVLGDAGGLFQERAQVIGLGLDQARDGALLDDRVTARTQTGAEKDVGDVATPTARVVEEIVRRAIA